MLDFEREEMNCWMSGSICNITLGKSGDAMIMLPAMKAIYDATGIKPGFVIAEEFAGVLSGVSYVDPWPVRLVWWKESDKAVAMAKTKYSTVIVGKWWDCVGAKPPLKRGEATTTLKFQGRDIVVSVSDWESYQLAQWEFSGFTRQQMMDWPLVFDRRDGVREEFMRRQWFKTKRPKLLYNLSSQAGNTSPFPYLPEVFPWLQKTFFELVDLSQIRAHRIYDLLGLYDHAALLVTADTATLHMASASKIPYIAFVNDGGSGSIPKGNCILSVRYSQVIKSESIIRSTLQNLANNYRSLPNSDMDRNPREGNRENNGRIACPV